METDGELTPNVKLYRSYKHDLNDKTIGRGAFAHMYWQKSKLGLIFVSAYIILLIAASAFLIVVHLLYPDKSEFAGVYILILTLPWSIAVVTPLNNAGVINSILILLVVFIICAIPNVFLSYWRGNKIEKAD
jgi:hypothetical protein